MIMTLSKTDVNSPHFWDELYKSNHFHWDLGGPTLVFQSLAERRLLKPGKMLVLGAGRGHDADRFQRICRAAENIDENDFREPRKCHFL